MLETASRFVITRMITQGILPEEDRAVYKLYNNSSKHVAINMTLTIDEYY